MGRRITIPRSGPWLFDVTLTAVLLVLGVIALFVYDDNSGNAGDALGLGVRDRVQAAVYAYESGLVQTGAL